MLTFKKIIIENFLSFYGSHEYKLHKKGVHWIKGINYDSPEDEDGDENSIASGKSSFTFAIQYAFFGEIEKKIKKDKIINKEAEKDLAVILEFMCDDVDYRIERYRKHSKEKDNLYLKMLVNEEWKDVLTKSTPSETQKEINKIVVVNNDTLLKSMLFSREDRKQFFELTQSSRINIFENIIQLNKFAKYLKRIKKKLKDVKEKLIALDRDRAVVNAKIDGAKESIEFEEQRIEKEKAKIFTNLKNAITTKKNEIESIKNSIETCLSNIKKYKKQIENYNDKFDTLKVNKCPNCNFVLNQDYLYDMKESISDDIKSKKKYIKSENEEKKELGNKLEIAKNEIEQRRKDFENFSNLDFKDDIDYTTIEKYKNKLKKLNTKLKKIKSAKTKFENRKEMLEWWIQALDVKNENSIKSYIMSKIIPVFNNLLRQNVNYAYDESVSVAVDQKLNETIVKDGEDYEYNEFSTGEKLKLNLCCNLSIFDMTRINLSGSSLLFLDEIFSNVDPPTVKKFLKVLKEKYSKNAALYIISHLKSVRDNIEPLTTTIIEKRNGRSSIKCF